MRIVDVVTTPGLGGFFYDDQAAIRGGVESDGFVYRGMPVTPGFQDIRIPARTVSIGLVLSDDSVFWGDMMGVQYSAAGGRDHLFDVDEVVKLTRHLIVPRLLGLHVDSLRGPAATVLTSADPGERLPLAVEYGVSQALLRAAAHAHRVTMAEQICAEFGLAPEARRVPLYAQSGDAREIGVDKMILKRVDILPHGLINSRAKFGTAGETFRQFATWVARRIAQLAGPDYRPILHFDVYGWIGLEFGLHAEAIADFIARLAEEVAPLQIQVECPADFGDREAQIDGYARIVELLQSKGSTARVVVDERCNTLQDISLFAAAHAGNLIQIKMPDVGSVVDSILAVMVCKHHNVGAYLGGSCVETDLSATLSVHVAVATHADMMLAKPGMGVDEALSIVGNEQNRLLTLLDRAARKRPDPHSSCVTSD